MCSETAELQMIVAIFHSEHFLDLRLGGNINLLRMVITYLELMLMRMVIY